MTTIAVTYDNGQIFQHFGRTEAFKIYKVEDGKIISSEVISAIEEGHEALSGQLSNEKIDIVICGGLGMGMLNALKANGIIVCANVSGDADSAVEAFLNGTLEYTSEAHCGHHHHEEGEEGGCHGGCGHSCHSDHEMVGNEGKTCKVHYTGTFNDGTKFDSSYDRGETLDFVCGAGMMIKGFDEAVKLMNVGETKEIHLMPEEAYGMPDPNNVFTLPIAELPGSEELEVNERAYLTNQMGQPFPVTVAAKTDTEITFDANHEMAGKELNFKIELIEVV